MIDHLLTKLREWWCRLPPKIRAAFGRVRLTLATFSVMLIDGLVVEARDYWPIIVQLYGWDLTTLQQGHVYAAWVGLFFSATPENFYGILLLLLLTMGVLEYRRGLCSQPSGSW